MRTKKRVKCGLGGSCGPECKHGDHRCCAYCESFKSCEIKCLNSPERCGMANRPQERKIDFAALERRYIEGDITLKELAAESGVPKYLIEKQASAGDWAGKKHKYKRENKK